MLISGAVPLQRVTPLRCQPCSCDVEYVETQVESLTTAPRPSLRQAAGRAIGRSSYKSHLAVISAPASLLPAGTLIRQQSRMGRGLKRSGDILFSLAVLGLGSPVLLFLALLVKLSSPGPVFYVQRRVGRGYQRFGCIKFRTMRKDAEAIKTRLMDENEADGPQFYIENDPPDHAGREGCCGRCRSTSCRSSSTCCGAT